ncbi:MAG: Asp-tRNA(Asn)/Glu-tRNA(Gln) amidotransferase subunit GatB [Betaproteobacteria bacterium]|nr:Asp-tRNA(Asn)/Glu-tRNA(Gln) amidotransferase subunit GatB [Betaproteobacteria bacterium]
MEWEIVIGLEVHAQLSTASKIFSGASTQFGAAPNAQACAVDIALPGVLPVFNQGAAERAVRFGLAVNANRADNINRQSIFARKNYFYPDLPKGYQISQYERPIVLGGAIRIVLKGGGEKTIRLTRAHLEEDAGKSLHQDFHGMSGIDLNRAGTPLLEIVSEPDMRSAEEAVAYARALHSLVRWIGICDGNMQEGSFRCDANVSVRPTGSDKLGTRREIKNLNSFRFLQQAIEYEAKWQIETIQDGGTITQATVLFDPDTGETRAMRTKEDAHDYRYFPDPDLLPLSVSEDLIAEMRRSMPELPEQRRQRYVSDHGLSAYDAAVLTVDRELGEHFEEVVRCSLKDGEPLAGADFKLCANWVINEVTAKLNEENLPSSRLGVGGDTLGHILRRLREGVINAKTAKDLFYEFWDQARQSGYERRGGHPQLVDELIESRGLKQVTDSGALEAIVDQVIGANPKSVEEYRAGKDRAFNALIGQAMKATKGKGNPARISEILKKKLAL